MRFFLIGIGAIMGILALAGAAMVLFDTIKERRKPGKWRRRRNRK